MADPYGKRVENQFSYVDAFGQEIMQLVEVDRPDPTRAARWRPGSEELP